MADLLRNTELISLPLSLLAIKIGNMSCDRICSLQSQVQMLDRGFYLKSKQQLLHSIESAQERKCVQETVSVCLWPSHIKKTSGGIPEMPQ